MNGRAARATAQAGASPIPAVVLPAVIWGWVSAISGRFSRTHAAAAAVVSTAASSVSKTVIVSRTPSPASTAQYPWNPGRLLSIGPNSSTARRQTSALSPAPSYLRMTVCIRLPPSEVDGYELLSSSPGAESTASATYRLRSERGSARPLCRADRRLRRQCPAGSGRGRRGGARGGAARPSHRPLCLRAWSALRGCRLLRPGGQADPDRGGHG